MYYEDDETSTCDECQYFSANNGFWPDVCELEGREVSTDDWDWVPSRPSWCPIGPEDD